MLPVSEENTFDHRIVDDAKSQTSCGWNLGTDELRQTVGEKRKRET